MTYLRERFNNEGDVDLLSLQSNQQQQQSQHQHRNTDKNDLGDSFDVHAVAGLLKYYFRELASPLLPKNLQKDVHDVMEQGNVSRTPLHPRSLDINLMY
jgi:hypothetical protein